MMNTMVMIEINNGTFDEWKKGFDALADQRAQFSRDAKVGKVDDNTAIVVVDVFDPAGKLVFNNVLNVTGPNQSINLEQLSSGVYLVHLQSNQLAYFTKLIKK